MVGKAHDKIIVHAPLEIFSDVSVPPHHADDQGPQRARGSPGRGGTVGASRKPRIGYANRHLQRRTKQSSPRRAQHRAQQQAGLAAPYFIPAAGRATQIQPGLDSLAAPELSHKPRPQGNFVENNGDYRQARAKIYGITSEAHAPPEWRRIRATPGPPGDEHSTVVTAHPKENGHIWPSNPYSDESGRPHASEDADDFTNGYSDLVLAQSRETLAAREVDACSECSNRTEGNCGWRRDSVWHRDASIHSEEPEYSPRYGPETRGIVRVVNDRCGGRGGIENVFAPYGGDGRRSCSEPEDYADDRDRGYDRALTHSERSEQAARVPRENSSSGNSDQTWMGGRRGLVHAGRGQECRSAYAMGDRTKHEDFSPGLQRHHAQKAKVPVSSARQQMPSPNSLPSDGAPSKAQPRVKLGPARHRFFTSESECPKPNPESLNEALVKSPKDMLLFSKKARQVDYKPCTLKQYREAKPTGYVELGKLQPDLYTDELVAKRANAERIKEFSANLRKINSDTAAAAARRGGVDPRAVKDPPPQDSRSKGLAFASRIPLPKARSQPKKQPASEPGGPGARNRASRRGDGLPLDEEGDGGTYASGGRRMSELEALEAMHAEMKRKVHAVRSGI